MIKNARFIFVCVLAAITGISLMGFIFSFARIIDLKEDKVNLLKLLDKEKELEKMLFAENANLKELCDVAETRLTTMRPNAHNRTDAGKEKACRKEISHSPESKQSAIIPIEVKTGEMPAKEGNKGYVVKNTKSTLGNRN
ncbi:MAG: hypothetical protein PHE58_01355 [Candidatus Omnitrophica bacterium]|nr:hypothetical protein [Candidatus Omnitrophota bacterium]